jgi:methylated-DNA-[protein]-cysteine S-methyltransferase
MPPAEPDTRTALVRSPFGTIVIAWRRRRAGPRVVRIFLPADEPVAPGPPGTCRAISRLAADLRRFLEGRPVEFDRDQLALDTCPPFQRAVLVAEHRVPRGRVTTYGALAARVGRPGAARAVGNALARNPFPIIIPCHRAIRSDGTLGGFRGGLAMKRALLELEGIGLTPAGRVRPEYIG